MNHVRKSVILIAVGVIVGATVATGMTVAIEAGASGNSITYYACLSSRGTFEGRYGVPDDVCEDSDGDLVELRGESKGRRAQLDRQAPKVRLVAEVFTAFESHHQVRGLLPWGYPVSKSKPSVEVVEAGPQMTGNALTTKKTPPSRAVQADSDHSCDAGNYLLRRGWQWWSRCAVWSGPSTSWGDSELLDPSTNILAKAGGGQAGSDSVYSGCQPYKGGQATYPGAAPGGVATSVASGRVSASWWRLQTAPFERPVVRRPGSGGFIYETGAAGLVTGSGGNGTSGDLVLEW